VIDHVKVLAAKPFDNAKNLTIWSSAVRSPYTHESHAFLCIALSRRHLRVHLVRAAQI
jgi:hypothetical protein